MLALTLTARLESTEEPVDPPVVIGYETLEASIVCSLHGPAPGVGEKALILGAEDSRYFCPTDSEITELLAFYNWRREDLRYISEAWDCDNMAREFKHWADVWAVHHYRHSAVAVAVGMVYVRLEGDVSDLFPSAGHELISTAYHVLGAILREDGQWLFFEPQTGRLVPVEGPLYEGSVTVLKINL